MTKQHDIKLHYNDDTDEEFIIHSDKKIIWTTEKKTKTVESLVKLYAAVHTVLTWFAENGCERVEIETEDEPE